MELDDIWSYHEIARVENIINRLKKALQIASDKDLAELLGVPKSTLSNWRSRNTMDYGKLFFICDLNNISLDWVISAKGMLNTMGQPDKSLLQDMLNEAILEHKRLKIQKVKEEANYIKSGESVSGKTKYPTELDQKIGLKFREIERLQRHIKKMSSP